MAPLPKRIDRSREVVAWRFDPATRAMRGLWLLVAVSLFACNTDEVDVSGPESAGPQSIAHTEGAVCGMVVNEQPAPRAQVVHRNGERAYLCSIADLMVHLDAPSPNGASVEVYVEVMEADEDPREIHRGPHDWVRAEDAFYRIGDERPRLIMGEPVMVYRDHATAVRALSHGPTEIFDFEGFRAWWRNRSR